MSFFLSPLLNATPLQCFAAGAALCATSLGTTFTILRTSGLVKSRLGVVLASAAMMDDVIGLVMVQVIANLGTTSNGQFSWRTVVRPLGVSLGFAIGVPFICWAAIRRLATKRLGGSLGRVLEMEHIPFILQTVSLCGMVTAAIYAGTSSLFAAYLAGAVISWWDDIRHKDIVKKVEKSQSVMTSEGRATGQSSAVSNLAITGQVTAGPDAILSTSPAVISKRATSGLEVYEKYYSTALHRVLKPFFFVRLLLESPCQLFRQHFVGRMPANYT